MVGLESTILDLSGVHPQLLCPGAVTVQALAEIFGEQILARTGTSTTRVPGSLSTHYAPDAPPNLTLQEAHVPGRIVEISETASLSGIWTLCWLASPGVFPGKKLTREALLRLLQSLRSDSWPRYN